MSKPVLRMTYTAKTRSSALLPVARAGSQPCCKDARWPAVVAALVALRENNRHSVRILDMDCGAGGLLLHTVRHARELGFTAIEARGVDGVPALIRRARTAALSQADPAIGLTFEVADLITALAEEQDFPADVLIWHGHAAGENHEAVMRAVNAAGTCIITDAVQVVGVRS